MNLFIIRHGKAVDGSKSVPDEWRWLTEEGRAAVKETRSGLIEQGIHPDLIITSPLVRAVQTAEVLIEKLKPNSIAIVSGYLLPNTNTHQLINYLKQLNATNNVMLVGHEPLLSSLVAELLGQPDNVISLKKGACTALEVQPGTDKKASFLWYLTPGHKPVSSLEKAFLCK